MYNGSDINVSGQYKQQGGWVGGDLSRVGVLIFIRAGRGFWGEICVLVISAGFWGWICALVISVGF